MISITDLPESILKDVATFLPQPSAALFAVAVTAPSSSWRESTWRRKPSAMGKAIVSSHPSRIVDFVDIEKELAHQLTDDDLAAILVCVDAVNKVKRLKLTGLVNIVGNGLEPLRGSTKLEQIDLSLVKLHESPKLQPESLIAIEAVIPVLNSIVEANGNSLKQIQFPHKWEGVDNGLDQMSEFLQLDQFRTRYNQLWESRLFNCAGAGRNLCPDLYGYTWFEPRNAPWFETDRYLCQRFTCYICLKNYCYQCDDTDVCNKCKKELCEGCNTACVKSALMFGTAKLVV